MGNSAEIQQNTLLNLQEICDSIEASGYAKSNDDGVFVKRSAILALERQAISLAKLFSEIVGERIVVVHKRSRQRVT